MNIKKLTIKGYEIIINNNTITIKKNNNIIISAGLNYTTNSNINNIISDEITENTKDYIVLESENIHLVIDYNKREIEFNLFQSTSPFYPINIAVINY